MTCQRVLSAFLVGILWSGVLGTAVSAPGGAAASAPNGSATTAPTAALPPLPLGASKVLGHIRQTLDWYRETQSLEQVPQLSEDVVSRDRLRETAVTVTRLAFDFGRAAAALLPEEAPQPASRTVSSPGKGTPPAAAGSGASSAPPRSLDQVSAQIASRISQLESQLTALNAQLTRARAARRAALEAQRDQTSAALGLEREVQTTVAELLRFQSSMLALQGTSSNNLLGQIADLERTVPEVRQAAGAAAGATGGAASGGTASGGAASGSAAPSSTASGTSTASSAPPAGSGANFHPESAGIISLIGQWIAIKSADSQLNDMVASTDALTKGLEALRGPLVAQARELAAANPASVDSTDPAELEASRRTLEAAAGRFRQLAALLVPLSDQDFALDGAHGTLTQWRNALRSRLREAARYLLLHLTVLATLIGIVLVISEVWRRAVFKYLHDSRRRSQFQTLRRVAVGIALVVVTILALVSQLGSLATYVGFLTAGLAVALQTVILSVVAYFFLIGRYGVRVGDRITLAGVTGRVVEIGLVRIYLMELAGGDLHSTGRIVVLSNSVLFQPQALFKQIPGADHLWHTISLTLAPSVDVQAAQQQLKATADHVYEHYRQSIEAQHAAVRRLVDFDTSVPTPEVRVRFADHGWHFDIRYPVQAEQAAHIDQRMLKAVRDALAGEPKLPVAESGEPALRPAEAE